MVKQAMIMKTGKGKLIKMQPGKDTTITGSVHNQDSENTMCFFFKLIFMNKNL